MRLSKVLSEFNVGVQTVVEFLQKKGFEIESNPNAKITDEQYELLAKEYKGDQTIKQESDKIGDIKKQKKEAVTLEKAVTAEVELVAPLPLQGPKIVGHLDIEKKPAKQPEPQPQPKVTEAEPKEQAPVAPAPKPIPEVKAQPTAAPKKEQNANASKKAKNASMLHLRQP